MKEKKGALMPYGKHRGRDVSDVPPAYLLWFLANRKMSRRLREAINRTLDTVAIDGLMADLKVDLSA